MQKNLTDDEERHTTVHRRFSLYHLFISMSYLESCCDDLQPSALLLVPLKLRHPEATGNTNNIALTAGLKQASA